jgi:hypothetical protein
MYCLTVLLFPMFYNIRDSWTIECIAGVKWYSQGNTEVRGDNPAHLIHCSPEIPHELAWDRHLGRLGERPAINRLRRSVYILSKKDTKGSGRAVMPQTGSEHAIFVFKQSRSMCILADGSCENYFDIFIITVYSCLLFEGSADLCLHRRVCKPHWRLT